MSQKDFLHAGQRAASGNRAYSSGALAIATTTDLVKTVSTINYTIDGIWYSKAATDNIAWAVPSGYPAMYVQPAGKTVYYVIALDSIGNVKTIQGDYSGREYNDQVTGLPRYGDGGIPEVPSDLCPIGILKVVTVGSTFTPDTTALTGISTFYNVAILPLTAP